MKVAQSISCFELLLHPWRFLERQVDTAEPLLLSPGAVSTAGSVNQRPRPLERVAEEGTLVAVVLF